MRFRQIFPLVFALLLFWAGAALATTNSETQTSFQKGVNALQKGDLKLARQAFYETLQGDPTQVVALYNLGLIEQRSGHNGLALALWRKALVDFPRFQPALDSIEWTTKKLQRSEIPHEVEAWETLRDSLLSRVSMEVFEVLSAILFFVALWLSLSYLGRRRRALLDEKRLPAFPVGALFVAICFAIVGLLGIAKAIDIQDLRATVIVKKIEARALPEENATVLFELYEGLEVVVRQSRANWIQVTYPGGSTGWVARHAVFTTADRVSP